MEIMCKLYKHFVQPCLCNKYALQQFVIALYGIGVWPLAISDIFFIIG